MLAEHTTGSLAGSANEQFTLAARVPVGTTALYLRGSRTIGAGTSLTHIGGRIYLLSEVSSDKVDVESVGFDGNLGPGDNTAQKAFQKLDDLVISTTATAQEIAWTANIRAKPTGSTVTVSSENAYRIGAIVFYDAGLVLRPGTAAAGDWQIDIDAPTNTTGTFAGSVNTYEAAPKLHLVARSNKLELFVTLASSSITTVSISISGWYKE